LLIFFDGKAGVVHPPVYRLPLGLTDIIAHGLTGEGGFMSSQAALKASAGNGDLLGSASFLDGEMVEVATGPGRELDVVGGVDRSFRPGSQTVSARFAPIGVETLVFVRPGIFPVGGGLFLASGVRERNLLEQHLTGIFFSPFLGNSVSLQRGPRWHGVE
jgi:hypothetical protein